jgi:hypothetical protein
MKLIKIIAAGVALATLAACKSEPVDDYVGRWSLQGGSSILEIADIGNNRLEIENTYIDAFHQKDKILVHAVVEDGIMTVGEPPFGQTMRYDPNSKRIRASSGVYRRVPAGWVWKDGYEGLE